MFKNEKKNTIENERYFINGITTTFSVKSFVFTGNKFLF